MTDHCIPLGNYLEVRRPYASDTSDLLDAVVILEQYHETGNAVICRTVGHLIYYIGL